MTPTFVKFATVLLATLGSEVIAGDGSPEGAAPSPEGIAAVVDVPAPQYADHGEDVYMGGYAIRIEFADAGLDDESSAWYRLAYVAGGDRLRVFEQYVETAVDSPPEIVESKMVSWRLASELVGATTQTVAGELPGSADIRTGHDGGPSAGLLFTLAYLDALTPAALVGDLRVAGTGTIAADGLVIPVKMVDVKLAAAMLAEPDVFFTPLPPANAENVTIVKAHTTRNPPAGTNAGEWLNVSGFEQAGRDAAGNPGTLAVVVVHDIRQALAWLCGRTDSPVACAIASVAADTPIGTP